MSETQHLAGGQLSTIDCVAQSLAVGPIFSGALLGGILAGLSGGVGPFVIVLTTVGILGLGWTVSEFAKRYSGSGTVYEFVAFSLGKRAAVFAAGVYHLAATALGGPGICIIGGLLAKAFSHDHAGFDLPWWVWSLIIAAVIFAVNVVGVSISVKAQLALVVVSVLPFLILAGKVIVDAGSAGNSIDSFNPSKIAEGGSIFKGILFAILMFIGFELAAALGEETRDPKRSIPRAVIATIVIVAVLYVVTQYTIAVGSGAAGSDFVSLGTGYFNRAFGIWIELAILLDVIAVGIGFQLAAARGWFSLARDAMLPKGLAKVSDRHLPVPASAVVFLISVAATLGALAKYKTDLVDPSGPAAFYNTRAFNAFIVCSVVGGMLICVVYFMVCLGALRKFALHRPVDAVAAVIGLSTCVLGVSAQFIDGTAPTGDGLWGRHIALGILGVVALWTAASRRQTVATVGQHAVIH